MGVAMLISDRRDFRARKAIRDKKRHYIMIKKLNIQEDITLFNVYAPNNSASNYMGQKLIELQEGRSKSIIITEGFNNPPPDMNRSSRQKITKDIVKCNIIINQVDIMNIYILPYSTIAEHTSYPTSQWIFTYITFWNTKHTLI